ncbi:MAG: GDYXXLXY domain-containing protein [Victivallaceae bacterium]|nr:GDYXXLXY domain-containing protein [Victivallaceae bacterium]
MFKIDRMRIVFFCAALVLALFYPVCKIVSFEYPSVPPVVMEFKVQGMAPHDPLRGRYVYLNIDQSYIELDKRIDDEKLHSWRYRNGVCYVALETDEDGLAGAVAIATDPARLPVDKPFMRVEYLWEERIMDHDAKGGDDAQFRYRYHFRYPFNRFYINEPLAPRADRLLAETARKGGEVHVSVNVYAHGGFSVNELYVDDRPIREILTQVDK